jgi:PAS domain S-box-containing protein
VAGTLDTDEQTRAASGPDEQRLSRPLLVDQVDLLFGQAGSAALFTLANGLLLSLALSAVVDHGHLATWFALLAAITGARYWLARSYRAQPVRNDAAAWRDRFIIGAALGGGCWGLAGTWLFPLQSPVHQSVNLIIIAGMAAGALSYQVAVPRAYMLYASATIVPTALGLLVSGEPVLPLVGILALLFLASLIVTCRGIHRTLMESLQLRYVNADLISDLADSQRQLRSANRRLQGEIAEHTRTEAELRDSFLFLKRIQDNTTNAIYVLDRDGRFVHVNHVTSELTGRTREAIVGRSFLQLFDEHSRADAERRLQQALHGETVTQYETALVRADGSTRSVSFNLAPLHEGTEVSAIVGTAEDVSERKRIERLKTEFLSTVSHELRTPLTSIRGSLGLLHNASQAIAREEAEALVGIAYKNTDRLIHLINDLLDIQKLEAGEMRFRFEVYTLDALVERALEINAGLAESYGVRFVLEHDAQALPVRVDRDRLEQVFTNLLSNAAKFSPKGGQITVSVQRHGDWARVAVQDRGRGIPDEFREQVFQKFAQADASDARREGGTGLGLSICRGIVERLDGRIDFSTEPGRGTTFFVDLPIVEREQSAAL